MTSTRTSTEARVAWARQEVIGSKDRISHRTGSSQTCLFLFPFSEPPCHSSFLQSPPHSLTVVGASSLCGETKVQHL